MPSRPLWLWLAQRLALAGMLPLLLVAALFLGLILPRMQADSAYRQQALAGALSSQVDGHLRSARRELSVLAEYLGHRAHQPAALSFAALLEAQVGGGELFAAIYLLAADDSVDAVGLPPGQRRQPDDWHASDRARWALVRRASEPQAPQWSEVFVSRVSSRRVVCLALPLGDRLLVGEVATDQLADFVGRWPTEAGMLTRVFDRQGQVIAHWPAGRGGQPAPLAQRVSVPDAAPGHADRQVFELEGEKYVAVRASAPELGGTVLIAQPRSATLGPLPVDLPALVGGALLALALATAATLLLARRLARRFERHTAPAHAFAEGDYEHTLPPSKITEFASLAEDVHRLAQALRCRERELAISEARFRDLSAMASDWFWEQDEQFRFTYFSFNGATSALERVGVSHSQAIGKTRWELPIDLTPAEWQAHRAVLEAHRPFRDFVYRINTAVGVPHWFNVNGQPLFNESGRFAGYRGTGSDITVRKRAEEELRQANLVVENSPAMLFRWRAEEGWPVVFVSHNVSQMGYRPAELLDGSIRFASLIHPDDLQRVMSEVRCHSAHGAEHFGQEYRMIARDGSIRWVDDRTAVERNAAGQISHYQGIVIDISERKQAEEALRRANRQLRMISDCNQALIHASDERELLHAVCGIMVDQGGYRMAWVGYAEHDGSRTLRPMASAGQAAGDLAGRDTGCADDERGRAAPATAIRSGSPCVVHHLASNARCAPTLERGHAAECALPLRVGEETLGALSIYASQVDAFAGDEVALLSKLAADLAFGIGVLRTRVERDQADAALRESEFLLRRSQQVGDLGSYSFDVRAGTWISSLKLDQILGIDENFPKTTAGWIELVHPQDRAAMLAQFAEQVLARGERLDRQYRIVRRSDGEQRWVHALGQFECDQRAVPIKLIGTVQDITAYKRATQALQDSEARYRLLFDSNPHPMWVYDLETLAFLMVNDAAVDSYGYSRGEFLNMTLIDLSPDEATPLLDEDIVGVEERGDYAGFWRHRRKDGSMVDVELISHPLSFAGRPAELVLANDITERQRSEQALLASELKYRDLVENANSIILRWSPAGEITFINEFGVKFFGYAEEELLGRRLAETIVPPTSMREGELRPLLETISLRPDDFEHQVTENICRAGERVWVSWTNKAIFDDWGRLIEVFSVGSDITEQKRAEDELQRHRNHLEELVAERTSELRQAMTQLVQAEKLAALGNLVAGVAHELNTPLGNSRVVASLLAEQLREFASAVESGSLRRSQVDLFLSRGLAAVELLERNSARAADLIGHFKQVAVDQSSARRRSFDLRQTVEEMLITLRPTFKHSPQRIEFDIPAGVEMNSFPGPLEQVIANLVANSLTHGLVDVEQGCITLRAHAVGEKHVALHYADNGVGMPKETLSRIFEPFFTTRLGQGGSGLGLYIVYNLVTGVLGGTIEVDSAPGQGARFTLTLPRSAADRVTAL